MTRKDRLWVAGLKTLVASIIATLAVRAAAVATLDIPTEFPPLAGPGPTVFFTAVGVFGVTGVYAVVHRGDSRPIFLRKPTSHRHQSRAPMHPRDPGLRQRRSDSNV